MKLKDLWVVAAGISMVAACTKANPAAKCTGNGTCTDPSYPYCDVDGSIGGEAGTCIAVTCTAGDFKSCSGSAAALVCNSAGDGYDMQSCQNGCDPSTGCVTGGSGGSGGSGSCTAGQALRCDGDQLVTCNADGTGETEAACALGCDGTDLRCKELDPSNGLATYLDQAAQQSDVTLPDGTTINTDSGTVNGPGGAIAVANTIIPQANGPMLRVLIAKSISIGAVRVTGTAALAIVSAGDITIHGLLDLSADGAVGGPGSLACASGGAGGAAGPGFFQRCKVGSGGYPTYCWSAGGGGGGGFGTAGGAGGDVNASVGATGGGAGAINGLATLVPLRGGCPGSDETGSYSGAGGGAVQLVSNQTVHLVDAGAEKGQLHVGGGGGHAGDLGRDDTGTGSPVYNSGGGGAGGGILIEAAALVLDANTGLLAAGGGGAGWGACAPIPSGTDAPASATTPIGGACPAGTTPTSVGGNGAATGNGGMGQILTSGCAGGGGGGLGRIRINTANAQYSSQSSSVLRGVVTTGTAQAR